MVHNSFEVLPIEKKKKILDACIKEFAQHGYENASTNRIVDEVNISKGSLFKYFNSKEELYFYIINYSIDIVTSNLAEGIDQLPNDIFDRVCKLAELEFDIYLKEPKIYKLFKKAFDGKSDISQKLIDKYKIQAGGYLDAVFHDSQFDNMIYNREAILDLFKWTLTGYNENFMNNNPYINEDVSQTKDAYLRGLKNYIAMIRTGIDK